MDSKSRVFRLVMDRDEAEIVLGLFKGIRPYEKIDVAILLDLVLRLEKNIANQTEDEKWNNRTKEIIQEIVEAQTNHLKRTITHSSDKIPEPMTDEELSAAMESGIAERKAMRGTDEHAE